MAGAVGVGTLLLVLGLSLVIARLAAVALTYTELTRVI